jgi:hypothetical protein
MTPASTRCAHDQLTFVLRQGAEDADHHPACRCRGVDAVGGRHQGDTTVSQRLDGFQAFSSIRARSIWSYAYVAMAAVVIVLPVCASDS